MNNSGKMEVTMNNSDPIIPRPPLKAFGLVLSSVFTFTLTCNDLHNRNWHKSCKWTKLAQRKYSPKLISDNYAARASIFFFNFPIAAANCRNALPYFTDATIQLS